MTDRTMTDITAARYDVVPVLSGAADLLTTEGWCQGEYKNQDGELCLIGAIKAFTPDSYARRSAATTTCGRRSSIRTPSFSATGTTSRAGPPAR